MADANFTASSNIELGNINPLIESNAEDTITRVSAVLAFLSSIFIKAEDDSGTMIIDNTYGLSLIVDTCRAALEHADHQKGGAA